MARTVDGTPHWENLCILHTILTREFTYLNFRGGTADVLLDFLDDLGREYDPSVSRYPEDVCNLLNTVIKGQQDKGILLGLAGKPVDVKNTSICRMITADGLLRYLPPELTKRYSPRDAGGLEKLSRHLQIEDRRREIERELTGTLKGYYFRWAFVTRRDSVAGFETEDVLIRLGFHSFGPSEHWVELEYPENFTEGNQLTIPTVLGAGAKALFRPRYTTDGEWGGTVRTDNFENGLPEAIHGECEIGLFLTEIPGQTAFFGAF